MSKNLSAKFYQERLQRKAWERYQNLSKDEKRYNMVVNITKLSQNMKSKSLLSIEKIL